MKLRGWSVLVLMAAAVTANAVSPPEATVSPRPAGAHPTRYDDAAAAIADYKAGLDALLAAIPDATGDDASPAQVLKRLVVPRLGWGRWQANGDLLAATPGSTGGVWVMVLEPDHALLATAGPTMTTAPLDNGLLVVEVRPDRMTQRWAGLFLMHEMSHAHDRLFAFERPACGREYTAYLAEADALDRLSAGRFIPLLDEQVAQHGWQTPAQYLDAMREQIGVAEMIARIEAGLGEAPALSKAEREMRDGFYAVAINERIGVRAGLDEVARCEATAALIASISLY